MSGNVADGAAAPTAGVTMTLTGPGLASSLTATTDGSGNYTYSAVPGDYTVTPSRNSSMMRVSIRLPPTVLHLRISRLRSQRRFTGLNFVTTVTTTNAYNLEKSRGSKSLLPIVRGCYRFWVTIQMQSYGYERDYIYVPWSCFACPFIDQPCQSVITVSGADLTVADFLEIAG